MDCPLTRARSSHGHSAADLEVAKKSPRKERWLERDEALDGRSEGGIKSTRKGQRETREEEGRGRGKRLRIRRETGFLVFGAKTSALIVVEHQELVHSEQRMVGAFGLSLLLFSRLHFI